MEKQLLTVKEQHHNDILEAKKLLKKVQIYLK